MIGMNVIDQACAQLDREVAERVVYEKQGFEKKYGREMRAIDRDIKKMQQEEIKKRLWKEFQKFKKEQEQKEKAAELEKKNREAEAKKKEAAEKARQEAERQAKQAAEQKKQMQNEAQKAQDNRQKLEALEKARAAERIKLQNARGNRPQRGIHRSHTQGKSNERGCRQ